MSEFDHHVNEIKTALNIPMTRDSHETYMDLLKERLEAKLKPEGMQENSQPHAELKAEVEKQINAAIDRHAGEIQDGARIEDRYLLADNLLGKLGFDRGLPEIKSAREALTIY